MIQDEDLSRFNEELEFWEERVQSGEITRDGWREEYARLELKYDDGEDEGF